MRKLRNALLVATGVVFGACATQTFRPEEAPEYLVTRDPTPFYLSKPRQEGTPDAALNAKTRVKLLRKQTGYSLVLLEDSRQGYVANAYLTQAPPGSQQRAFGSSSETEPPRRKRRAAPSPTPVPETIPTTETPPATDTAAPPTNAPTPPDLNAPSGEVPSASPTPQVPLEKPKFRL
jgi:hypothetical protein